MTLTCVGHSRAFSRVFVSNSNLDQRLITTERQPWRDIIWDLAVIFASRALTLFLKKYLNSELSFHSFFAFCSPRPWLAPSFLIVLCNLQQIFPRNSFRFDTKTLKCTNLGLKARNSFKNASIRFPFVFNIFHLKCGNWIGIVMRAASTPLWSFHTAHSRKLLNIFLFFCKLANILLVFFKLFNILFLFFKRLCDNLTWLWPNAKPSLFVYVFVFVFVFVHKRELRGEEEFPLFEVLIRFKKGCQNLENSSHWRGRGDFHLFLV